MRCTTKLTCIAQCLAASILHRFRLLTDEDYALLGSVGITPVPNSDDYTPNVFPAPAHLMQHIKLPVLRYAHPLIVEGVGSSSSCRYYSEWREQLSSAYQVMLRRYADQTLRKNNFQKRGDDSVVASLVDEFTKELKQIFLSSELLVKSYKYVMALIHAYNEQCNHFYYIMKAVYSISAEVAEVCQNLHEQDIGKLDESTIEKLNTLREKLDNSSNRGGHASMKFFGKLLIPSNVLGTSAAPKVVDNDFIKTFKVYCEKALAHVSTIRPKISREMIVCRAFGIYPHEIQESPSGKEEIDRNPSSPPVTDPFKYLHYVYPEMNYEGWASFWKAIQEQLTDEVVALKNHVDEVYIAISNCDKVVPGLFEEFDSAIDRLKTIGSDGETHPEYIQLNPEMSDTLISIAVEAAAEKMLNQFCRANYEKTNTDKDAFVGEPATSGSRY